MNSISKKVLKTHTIVTVRKSLFNFLLKKNDRKMVSHTFKKKKSSKCKQLHLVTTNIF